MKHKSTLGYMRDRIVKGPINQRVFYPVPPVNRGPRPPKVKPGSMRWWKLKEFGGEYLTANMLRTKLKGMRKRKERNK